MSAARTETPTQILETARDLVLRDGVTGLSMRKVAAECGISAPAIYRHFKDKDALLGAVLQEGAQAFTAYLVDALKEATPEGRLRKMGQRYFDFALSRPRDYELLFLTNCSELGLETVDKSAKEASGSAFQLLVDRVTECQRAKVLVEGDAVEIAVFIWSSVHGLASLFLTGSLKVEDAAAKALMAHQVERIFAGVLRPHSKAR